MKIKLLFILITTFLIFACKEEKAIEKVKVRPMADTIGFAQYGWQVDSIISRIYRTQNDLLSKSALVKGGDSISGWKTVISPHDDYAYVGYLYPEILQNLTASTIIIFGVAHKAKKLGLENQIIFDSYSYWHGPYGNITISSIREEIMKELANGIYQENDSMQTIEHSVEALLPF
ncbi:MAG: AmmeMemoRadiSam system protein B, partial [Calditrichia bacterium]|nr:AmmeMemoRadiSam system protein B [Calditrichia bacterium]